MVIGRIKYLAHSQKVRYTYNLLWTMTMQRRLADHFDSYLLYFSITYSTIYIYFFIKTNLFK